MARQKGKGLGGFLKKFGKKHGKKLGRYALKRAKEIARGEASKAANYTLQSLGGQKGGSQKVRKRKSQKGGGLLGKFLPIALQVLAGAG